MDDSEVIKAINNNSSSANNKNGSDAKKTPTNTASFVFTLKNRVGGLARALHVLQVLFYHECHNYPQLILSLCLKECGLNVVHIESRQSMRTNSEYEIFVNLENENGEVSAPALVRSLKRQISYIQIDPIEENIRKSSERESNRSHSSVSSSGGGVGSGIGGGGLLDEEVFHTEKYIDTTNTTLINSDGFMIRRSTRLSSKIF